MKRKLISVLIILVSLQVAVLSQDKNTNDPGTDRPALVIIDIQNQFLPMVPEEEKGMAIPREKFGLRIVSMGMTAGQNEAFIWRGPLVAKMIRRLLDLYVARHHHAEVAVARFRGVHEKGGRTRARERRGNLR